MLAQEPTGAGSAGANFPTATAPGAQGVPDTSQGRLARGERLLSQLAVSARRVQAQLKSARDARDVVRVLCLNDKVSQVDVALRSADGRLSALRQAGEAEAERSIHDFAVLQVLAERVQDLTREADQCIGEESGFDVDANVTVSIDPGLPDRSVADFAAANTFLASAPRVASGIE